MTGNTEAGRRPSVVLLTAHWGSSSESGWITRQVAGALASAAEVDVVTPDGQTSSTSVDSVFRVHRLGSPVPPESELRRDLLVEELSTIGDNGDSSRPGDLPPIVDPALITPWRGASDIVSALEPDLIVIADHRNVGALAAIDRLDRDVPVALVALAHQGSHPTFPWFAPLFDRSSSILTVTEDEFRTMPVSQGRPTAVHQIGAPLSTNASARSEPNPWVGDTGYLLVRTATLSHDAGDNEYDLARLLRLRFPDRPVGICHTDAFCVWHEGRLSSGWPIERSSDLARLMAWAAVTVDLCPGPLFARASIESLLYGAPIVVPQASRAREHAKRGHGGLWFSTAGELLACVEALLEPVTHDTLAAQGRAYATEAFGSTDRFIDRVLLATGLAPLGVPAPDAQAT